MMKISHSLAWLALAAAALFAVPAGAQDAETFRRALELYDGGMYAEAAGCFQEENPVSRIKNLLFRFCGRN